jgi:MATE family multidrug resistance protein
MPSSAQYGVRRGVMAGPEVGRKLFRIGYPFGIAQGIEASAFSGLVLMAGLVGTAALGGYQIAQNLIALVYMAAIGISVATAVRVGNAVGRADRPGVAAAGWTGVGLVILVMAVIALVFARVPELLVSIYSSDQAVVSVAASTVLIAAALLVFDGMQGVLMGALRGAGDVWMPVVMHMISFYLVALPAAAIMAFVLGYGAPGLMMGMFGGVLCAAVLMSWRFRVISSRAVRRL